MAILQSGTGMAWSRQDIARIPAWNEQSGSFFLWSIEGDTVSLAKAQCSGCKKQSWDHQGNSLSGYTGKDIRDISTYSQS
jgi:hypothetical protein